MSVASKLLAIQSEDVKVVKDAVNPHFKNTYASLGAVLDALRPALKKHGLVVTQSPATGEDGAMEFRTLLMDPEDQTVATFQTPLIIDKENMQGLGSAITYMRRYQLVSIFGLDADEDDDGNAASTTTVTKKRDRSDARAI